MVLVPFENIQPERQKKDFDDEEINFSKHTDTPFMSHIKLQMRKTLRNPGLSMRDKSRVYSQLLKKYQIAKENHLNEVLKKTQNEANPARSEPSPPQLPDDGEDLWVEEEMPYQAPHVGEVQNYEQPQNYEYDPRGYQQYRGAELTDDETEYDDISLHSEPTFNTAPVQNIVSVLRPLRKRNLAEALHSSDDEGEIAQRKVFKRIDPAILKKVRKRNLFETIDPDEAGTSSGKKGKNIKPPPRRRNAIDTPPTKLVRFRKNVANAGVLKTKNNPSELYRLIDNRFMSKTRKRAASKLYTGKRRWLGSRIGYEIPPKPKQKKYNVSDSDDEAPEESEWSQLPK